MFFYITINVNRFRRSFSEDINVCICNGITPGDLKHVITFVCLRSSSILGYKTMQKTRDRLGHFGVLTWKRRGNFEIYKCIMHVRRGSYLAILQSAINRLFYVQKATAFRIPTRCVFMFIPQAEPLITSTELT